MQEISKLFESLYSHFVLRDIAAKVLPGLTALASIAVALHPITLSDLEWVQNVPVGIQVVVLYGIGLATGLVLQFIGMKSGLARIHIWDGDDGKASTSSSVRQAVDFILASKENDALSRKRERLVVMKEMMGNYGIALLLIALINLIQAACKGPPLHYLVVALTASISAIPFLWHNRVLSDEQRNWEEYSIEKLGNLESA